MSEINPYQPPETQPQAFQAVNTIEGSGFSNPYGPPASAKNSAIFSKILLWANVAMTVGVLGLMFSSSYEEEYSKIFAGDVSTIEYFKIFEQLAVIALILLLASVISICIWTSRVMKNAWAIGGDNGFRPMTTPGWAVGWYFIPFANLVKPYFAVKEIWAATFKGFGGAGILLVWWLCWVFSGILDRVSLKWDIENMGDVVAGKNIDLAAGVLTVIAAVCLIQIITRITRKQDELIAEMKQKNPSTFGLDGQVR